MSEISDQAPCEDWWATSIIEMRPGHDPLPRLRDRGPHRPDQLPGDDLADAARRAAERRPGRSPRHGAHGGGRSRAAGAVDRHRPDGRDLRRRHQQRHGLGDQRAGRRAWRRRRAVRRDLPGDRRPHRRRRGDRRRRSRPSWRHWPSGASSSCRASAIASTPSTRAHRGCSRWSRRQRPQVWSVAASPRSAAPSRRRWPGARAASASR